MSMSTILAADEATDHDVAGRFTIASEVGGAVWAFQPSGKLIVTGPGQSIAEGDWMSADGSDTKFDASLDVGVTSQDLTILGEVSPSGDEVALFVAATAPDDQQNALPWPAESRVTGQRLGVITEPSPEPSLDPIECLRPSWTAEGSVDWDRCGSVEPSAAGAASPSPQP
jgi:hypothetical protein